MDSIGNKPYSQELEDQRTDAGMNEGHPPIVATERQQSLIRRKYDRHLLPIICVLYVLSYLDRGNIGNAKTSTMMEDLALSDEDWVWVLQAFYISYVLFEWSVLLWKIFPAHIYVATLCLLWGSAAMATGATKSFTGVVVCRIFLGIFEAAFGAGAPYLLSLFYKRRELGMRVAILTGMSPLANCFAATLAYGILHIKSSIEPWRLLFFIEGAPTVAFSVVVFFFLPDSPDSSYFLTDEEKNHALSRLDTVDETAKSKVNWAQITAGLFDYQNYCYALIHFGCNYSFASLSNFLPTIVRDMGYSSLDAQGLVAPAYLAAFVCCVMAAWLSDRYGRRGPFIALFATIGTVGYLLLATIREDGQYHARYAAIYLACCGIFPALSLNLTWLLNNQGGDSKRGAGLGLLATFGQCSSFVSSTLFPSSDSPLYVRGCATGCALSGMTILVALGLHFKLDKVNKQRDRLNHFVDYDVPVNVTAGGDNNDFRYLT